MWARLATKSRTPSPIAHALLMVNFMVDKMSNFDFDMQQQKKHYQAMDDNASLLVETINGIKNHAMFFSALLHGNTLTNKHGHLLSLENGCLTLAVGATKTTDIKRIEPSKWRIPNEQDLIKIETRNALKKLTAREKELLGLLKSQGESCDEATSR